MYICEPLGSLALAVKQARLRAVSIQSMSCTIAVASLVSTAAAIGFSTSFTTQTRNMTSYVSGYNKLFLLSIRHYS